MAVVERIIPADHPAAQGHFPGDPVIPGAVVLSEALRAIEASLGADLSLCRVRFAKFSSPTRPGDRIAVDFSSVGDRVIRIACSVSGRPVLKAEVQCDRTA